MPTVWNKATEMIVAMATNDQSFHEKDRRDRTKSLKNIKFSRSKIGDIRTCARGKATLLYEG